MGEFNFKKYLKEGKLIKEDREAEEMAAGMPPRAGSERDKRIQDKGSYMMSDPSIGSKINDIINTLNSIEVDGETMEYILQKIGMDEQMLKQLSGALKENKSLKENSDDYISDQNAGYLIDQIADDMMYTEFENKEDINKFIDSIIEGINKLRSEKIEQWEEENTEPDFMDPDFDPNLEEGRHGPGRRMDDEYDEPNYPSRYDKFNRYSSRSQDEEEFDEEDIEFTRGKDYNAQNQRVLRNMDESKFDKALKKASTKLKENEESRKAYLKGMKYDNEDVLKNDPIGKALKSSADRYFKKEKEDIKKSKIKEEGEVKEYYNRRRRKGYGDDEGEQRFGKPGFIQLDNEEVKYTLDSRKYDTPYDEWKVGDYLDIDSSYDETYKVKDKKSGEIITNVTAVRPS